MNYAEAIQYIDNLSTRGIVPGLDNIRELLRLMGNPQKKLKFIHVAGTNGKGSISTMTSNILKISGYKTGLYTSPFMYNVRDAIKVNGVCISKKEFAECVSFVKRYSDEMYLSFKFPTRFEIETAIAFEWFKRQGCDIVCLEVGLGGRLDATNIINTSILNVITAISLDHTNFLGNTLEKITLEKCGIIKNAPTIMYPLQEKCVENIIRNCCEKQNSELIVPDKSKLEILDSSWQKNIFIYDNLKVEKSLSGLFQIYNSITVYEIVKKLNELGFEISKRNIVNGIKNTVFEARMEVISKKPLIILDGAHNLSAFESLEKTLCDFKNNKITIIMGMLADKDYESCINVIAKYANNFIAITPENTRALDCEKLAKVAERYCKDVFYSDNLNNAINIAIKKSSANDVIIICGSLYIVSQIKSILIEKIDY